MLFLSSHLGTQLVNIRFLVHLCFPPYFSHVFLDLPAASGHIGQPCLPLGICWPLNIHIYCDENRTCRCRPETPVVVGPHACKRNKSHGDKCSSDQECLYSDNNSFCDNSHCNCVSNYTYDPFLIKCVHGKCFVFLFSCIILKIQCDTLDFHFILSNIYPLLTFYFFIHLIFSRVSAATV